MSRWREWAVRLHRNPSRCGLSLGLHVDPAPRVEIHFLVWILTVGWLRMVDVPRFGVMEASADFWRAATGEK